MQAWERVGLLADPQAQLDAAAARAALARFGTPPGERGNLGPRLGASWLHVPVALAADAPAAWTLRMTYPLLHDVQVSVFDGQGQLVQKARLGARVPFSEREGKTRGLTARLLLEPGQRYDVLLRVETPTGALVDFAFLQPQALLAEESDSHALLGVLTGLWLFMAAYSLIHWVQLRERMFLAYVGTLLFSWLFVAALFGFGPKYLWPDSVWLATHMSALAPLLMTAANTQFINGALETSTRAPVLGRWLNAIGLLALLLAVLFMLDWLPYRVAAVAGMSLGVAHLLLPLRQAVERVRQGQEAALFLVLGWSVYLLGIVSLSALLRGALPVNFFTLHSAPLATALEMISWMMVLASRVAHIRVSAAATKGLNELLDAQAHTDALTGLLNRRGLQRRLDARAQAPVAGEPAGVSALLMIDLDGFKPINDRWGHDVGDEVLRQVALRLRHACRNGDAVARLGGDEFVVVASGLADAAAAERVGQKLLRAFDDGFAVGPGRQGRVGATIGLVVCTRRDADAGELLRRADAAMYEGKQAGKGRVILAAMPA